MFCNIVSKQLRTLVSVNQYAYNPINICANCYAISTNVKQTSGLSFEKPKLYRTKYNLYYGAEHVLNNLSKEDKEVKEQIQIQVDKFNQSSFHPVTLRPVDWIFLLLAPNFNKREAYLSFRCKTAATSINETLKRQKVVSESDKIISNEYVEDFPNTMAYPKVNPSIIRSKLDTIMWRANQFAQPIVFDMSFEDFMRPDDVNNLSVQLALVYSIMKSSYFSDPLHMHFTSFDPTSFSYWCCRRHMIKTEKFEDKKFEDTIITATEASYLDLFPKERLVYLTPNSRDVFQEGEWNHDDVYIIGGFVDKIDKRPHTYTKAKKQGIRTKSLPFDRHITWKTGSKSLPLDRVMKILLTARDTNGDWGKAIKDHVPKRKTNEIQSKDSLRLIGLLKRI